VGSFEPTQVPEVRQRMPRLLEVLDRFVDQAFEGFRHTVAPQTNIEFVRLRMFDRAFNVAKGIRLLVEHDHWELAAPLVRQVFELILTLEELHRADDANAAVQRYLRFAAMQDVRHRLAGLRYDISTGRSLPPNTPAPESVEYLATLTFPEFVHRDKKGELVWSTNWSGLSFRQLARRSERNIRAWQYETIYSMLSIQVHGAPMALAGGFAELTGSAEPSAESLIEEQDYQLLQLVSLGITFLCDLWVACSPPVGVMPTTLPDELGKLLSAMREAGDS
jgi:hypothetical protein